jgi:hypothetical protein
VENMLLLDRVTPTQTYSIDYPRNDQLLDELYHVDCEAYGEFAVDRSILERWVKKCPQSITVMLVEGRIAGAFGLLAVSEEQIRKFIAGELPESQFSPLPERISKHRFWYWSGVVLRPEFQGQSRSLLRPLLVRGLDSWLSSQRIGHPDTYVYATGCTNEGRSLLDRFQFEQIKEADEMVDGAPLYVRKISPDIEQNRNEIRELLCARS